MKYYAVYNMEEELVYVANNYKELSKWFGRDKASLQTAISLYISGKINSILSNVDKKQYTIYKMKDEEEV